MAQDLDGTDARRLFSVVVTAYYRPDVRYNLVPSALQVYVAAGAVFGLEAELSDLEECARSICSATSDMELSFLEEQVASAAAKVQQSDLQVDRSWTQSRFIAGSVPLLILEPNTLRAVQRLCS